MTDITELAQSLKALANNAGADYWQAKKISGDFYVIRKGSYKRECGYTTYQPIAEIDHKPTRDYVAMANPTNILALVEALEKAQRAGSIDNQWKPDVCPITGRRFFLWIEHPELGYVPTYGGPYDSYTIPKRDSDGEFSCERYDHDVGGWVDGECVGAYLIDDDEQCRVYELEQRIAELESQLKSAENNEIDARCHIAELESSTVKIPYLPDDCDRTEAHYKYQAALRAAGIKVEAE